MGIDMYENYKDHSIQVDRVSYGANGNPGKIEWHIDFKGNPTVFDEIVGFKTVKAIMQELKCVVDDGLVGFDNDDGEDDAFERAAGIYPEKVRSIDSQVYIWCVIILTLCSIGFGSRLL